MRGKKEESCDLVTEPCTIRISQFSIKNKVAEPARGRGRFLSPLDSGTIRYQRRVLETLPQQGLGVLGKDRPWRKPHTNYYEK